MLSNSNSSIKVLVCGAGSIGRRHITNLISLGVDLYLWRSRTELSKKLSDEYNLSVFTSLDEAIMKVDAVIIATATNNHLEIAYAAVEHGKSIFIEKPISHSMNGLKKFVNFSNKKNLVVEVGFQLRAHPSLIKLSELISKGQFGPLYTFRAVVGHRLDLWRPETDYRQSYSSDSSQGGGALLDLIHEIDLINWLVGPVKSVKASLSQVSNLEMKAEDLVNLILANSNGAVGQVQMDMLSPVYRRSLELVFQDSILYWDYVSGVLEYRVKGKTSVLYRDKSDFDRNTLYFSHMKHFLNRMKSPDIKPLCSLEDGVSAQQVAEAAKLSNEKNSTILLKEVAL